jgi:peptidoglycan biosynthesis protein MviN/MurJ (putative lipid II flippase)
VLAIFVTGLFQHEAPLGIILAGGLQALVVLFVLWGAAVVVSPHWNWRRSELRTPSKPQQDALT